MNAKERIVRGLIYTAMGNGYNGIALRDAKAWPDLTTADLACLERYLAGTQRATDHVTLQYIAIKILESAP